MSFALKFQKQKKSTFHIGFSILSLTLLLSSCQTENIDQNVLEKNDPTNLLRTHQDTYEFEGRVYDIAAAPDGSIMVGLNTDDTRSIQLIKNGEVSTITALDTDTDINGIASIGAKSGFATTAGTDQALDGELFRFSNGNARIVADLAAFERNVDPDALEGIQWKAQVCEASPVYTAGPQNNPYNVSALSGSEVLVADAAGNSILKADDEGNVDWFAILTPPTDGNGEWIELGQVGDVTCYAQPVPTAIAVGPDGYAYIGELTGALVDGLPVGLSRIWKIPADAKNVTCSEGGSGECELLIEGLTSVIDVAIGPDNLLYVVEYDENSWLTAYGALPPAGGKITVYDLDGNLLETVAAGLSYPSAITFDKKGNLWLLENNFVLADPTLKPTVRMLTY